MSSFLEELDGDDETDGYHVPPEKERAYYRHAKSGDRGYIVWRGGARFIRLDRANQDITRRFESTDWVPDEEKRPLTREQVARIAHAADKQFCYATGRVKESRTEWHNLPEEIRVDRISGRGPRDPQRGRLFNTIFLALKDLTSG